MSWQLFSFRKSIAVVYSVKYQKYVYCQDTYGPKCKNLIIPQWIVKQTFPLRARLNIKRRPQLIKHQISKRNSLHTNKSSSKLWTSRSSTHFLFDLCYCQKNTAITMRVWKLCIKLSHGLIDTISAQFQLRCTKILAIYDSSGGQLKSLILKQYVGYNCSTVEPES